MDGKTLLKARKILNLSQEEMAAELAISYQTYNGYENGRTIPKTKYAKINEVLLAAENRKENADAITDIESTGILNSILKEIKAVRRENKEIKNLLNEIISKYSKDSKLNELSSSQIDILRHILENISTQLDEKENKKADLKSAGK